jgi:hypothetical protein
VVFEDRAERIIRHEEEWEEAGKLHSGRSIICTPHQVVTCGSTHRGGEIYC